MSKICGIYKITSPSNKIYIGQTMDFVRRFRQYEKLECKLQIRLFNSFNKYGVKNHTFEIIEKCNIEDLNERERYWQEFYDVIGKNGLNCRLTQTNTKSQLLSEETKNKISKSNIGKIVSNETKQKMSKIKLGSKKVNCLLVINILTNTIYNSLEEAKIKEELNYSLAYMRTMLGNLKHNKTNLRYFSKKDIPILEKSKYSKLGTKHSLISKLKISNSKKGHSCNGKKVINEETNIIYESAKEAFESQIIIKTCGTFRAMLRGNLKNKTNYKYLKYE